MFRIVHLITGLGTGGTEMTLYKLLSRMDRCRLTPAVISLSDKGTLGERIEDLGIAVHTIGLKPGRPQLASIWKLLGIGRRLKPDMIHGWMYHGNLAALLCAVLNPTRPPVIWSIRQSLYSLDDEKRGTAAIIKAGRYLSKYPRRITYNSRTAAGQHEALGYNPCKRVIIPNGFDTDAFKPSTEVRDKTRRDLNIPRDALVIGHIGRYHPMKDHSNFIRAAAILMTRHPSTRFVMAGPQMDGNNTALLHELHEFNLLSRVHLLGERSDMPRITALLDISTSSSYSESFPNVIGEAMACGVPCVVTDVGDSAWVVGDTGKIVPPRDPEALARSWKELAEAGAEGRMILGQRARQRIIDNFSLDALVRSHEQLYCDVLEKGELSPCAA